jgi:hypothetical protein
MIWYSEPGSRNAAATPNYVTMVFPSIFGMLYGSS